MSDDDRRWENPFWGREIYRRPHTRSAEMTRWQEEQALAERRQNERIAEELRGIQQKYPRERERQVQEHWASLVEKFGIDKVLAIARSADPKFELPDGVAPTREPKTKRGRRT